MPSSKENSGMSMESANRFLEAVAYDEALRNKFEQVDSPEDFLRISEQLGYSFTTAELMALAKEQSMGVSVRRNTGVWKWLRGVKWV
ncbi:Nif11-like leader peptide family natural product precursor [Kovacikia minuta CCNUW1]|uniref:Nif11-like leader peptide family natural product precursor n=1 Tax=Kovacikia minuta TaxID=2931930 RepID=UPI001CC9C1EC|nr:Nif11-like leader peptide family natural product precursor [Kovacikia minuta]UBF28191.1 Nif11-like leader peptide family natural product precursor [Kovacikia minuta CCNUW1]